MTLNYLRIEPGRDLPDVGDLRPFRAVVIAEDAVDPAWQQAVSDWLVASGCLYMMAWGCACDAWDTSVDIAYLESIGFGDMPEDTFVMTTAHQGESLSDVFWFCHHVAADPTFDLRNVLLVHIGARNREEEFLALYRQACAVSGR